MGPFEYANQIFDGYLRRPDSRGLEELIEYLRAVNLSDEYIMSIFYVLFKQLPPREYPPYLVMSGLQKLAEIGIYFKPDVYFDFFDGEFIQKFATLLKNNSVEKYVSRLVKFINETESIYTREINMFKVADLVWQLSNIKADGFSTFLNEIHNKFNLYLKTVPKLLSKDVFSEIVSNKEEIIKLVECAIQAKMHVNDIAEIIESIDSLSTLYDSGLDNPDPFAVIETLKEPLEVGFHFNFDDLYWQTANLSRLQGFARFIEKLHERSKTSVVLREYLDLLKQNAGNTWGVFLNSFASAADGFKLLEDTVIDEFIHLVSAYYDSGSHITLLADTDDIKGHLLGILDFLVLRYIPHRLTPNNSADLEDANLGIKGSLDRIKSIISRFNNAQPIAVRPSELITMHFLLDFWETDLRYGPFDRDDCEDEKVEIINLLGSLFICDNEKKIYVNNLNEIDEIFKNPNPIENLRELSKFYQWIYSELVKNNDVISCRDLYYLWRDFSKLGVNDERTAIQIYELKRFNPDVFTSILNMIIGSEDPQAKLNEYHRLTLLKEDIYAACSYFPDMQSSSPYFPSFSTIERYESFIATHGKDRFIVLHNVFLDILKFAVPGVAELQEFNLNPFVYLNTFFEIETDARFALARKIYGIAGSKIQPVNARTYHQKYEFEFKYDNFKHITSLLNLLIGEASTDLDNKLSILQSFYESFGDNYVSSFFDKYFSGEHSEIKGDIFTVMTEIIKNHDEILDNYGKGKWGNYKPDLDVIVEYIKFKKRINSNSKIISISKKFCNIAIDQLKDQQRHFSYLLSLIFRNINGLNDIETAKKLLCAAADLRKELHPQPEINENFFNIIFFLTSEVMSQNESEQSTYTTNVISPILAFTMNHLNTVKKELVESVLYSTQPLEQIILAEKLFSVVHEIVHVNGHSRNPISPETIFKITNIMMVNGVDNEADQTEFIEKWVKPMLTNLLENPRYIEISYLEKILSSKSIAVYPLVLRYILDILRSSRNVDAGFLKKQFQEYQLTYIPIPLATDLGPTYKVKLGPDLSTMFGVENNRINFDLVPISELIQGIALYPDILEDVELVTDKNINTVSYNSLLSPAKWHIWLYQISQAFEDSRDRNIKELADIRNRNFIAKPGYQGIMLSPLRLPTGTLIHGFPIYAGKQNNISSMLSYGINPSHNKFKLSDADLHLGCIQDKGNLRASVEANISSGYGHNEDLGKAGQLLLVLGDTKFDADGRSYDVPVGEISRNNHYVILGGLPATQIQAIIYAGDLDASLCKYDRYQTFNNTKFVYETVLDKLKYDIARNGFYIPIYNIDGELLYFPAEYDLLRTEHGFDYVTFEQIDNYVPTQYSKGSNMGEKVEIHTPDTIYAYLKYAYDEKSIDTLEAQNKIAAELLVDGIMKQLGLLVPETSLVWIDDKNIFAKKSRWIEGTAGDSTSVGTFALAALLLGNHDAFINPQNYIVDEEGKTYLLDNGNNFLYYSKGTGRYVNPMGVEEMYHEYRDTFSKIDVKLLERQFDEIEKLINETEITKMLDATIIPTELGEKILTSLMQRKENLLKLRNVILRSES